MKRQLPLLLLALFVSCEKESTPQTEESASPYITKVFEYVPAPGQFVNTYPSYSDGDTSEDMNEKVLAAIGGYSQNIITLGGYGGYVVVGFDQTIPNVEGEFDFRVLGNAFSGSGEAGIIMVSYDANGNGLPDDEWYEIAGSAHTDFESEEWYATAVESGSDTNFYNDFVINYLADEEGAITWCDNKGNEGVAVGNFPKWLDIDSMQFSGTRLPNNCINIADEGSSARYFLYKFSYGYADNATNVDEDSKIDIGWAVDADGNPADLAGVDFIKIYTGVNASSTTLGECSTEVMGVVNLHL